jgi:hypothetical protein
LRTWQAALEAADCEATNFVKDDAMATARHRFRVYYGPESEASASVKSRKPAPRTVTLPLGEILPLLADAVNSRRTWLEDFADDQITINSDLYEVILAYQHHIRPGA